MQKSHLNIFTRNFYQKIARIRGWRVLMQMTHLLSKLFQLFLFGLKIEETEKQKVCHKHSSIIVMKRWSGSREASIKFISQKILRVGL